MVDKLTLYPIHAIGETWDEHPLASRALPFEVVSGITVENVSGLFNESTFRWVEREMGTYDLEDLRSVRFAIVHRYKTDQGNGGDDDTASEKVVREIGACLRLIRPMRQRALLIQGKMSSRNGFDVQHFDHPVNLMEVPEVQKLFHLRDGDLELLRGVAQRFLTVMNAEYWKIRMAVQFHEGGHWQHLFWKPRFSLWMAGLEALYTTPDSEHNGRLVTTERVKQLLGADTNIYEKGDLQSFLPQIEIKVTDVLNDIYRLRNYVVHGERVPDEFSRARRQGVNGDVNHLSVLIEALSFILRKSLIRVLRDDLTEEFKDSPASRRYWRALWLTRSELRGRVAVEKILRECGRPLTLTEITQILNQEIAAKLRLHSEDEVNRCISSGLRIGTIATNNDGAYFSFPTQ